MKQKIIFNPFPILKTNRLHLRQLENTDAAEIFELRSSEAVNRYIDRPKATSIEDANNFIHSIWKGISENKNLYWAMQLLDKKNLIGTICLWNFSAENTTAEVGFELLPTHQGLGFMNEALQKIIEFAYVECHIEKLKAYVQVGNKKSVLLLQKNNFKIETGVKIEEGVSYHNYYLKIQ